MNDTTTTYGILFVGDKKTSQTNKEYVLEHPIDCSWHNDWHACDCGMFDKQSTSVQVNGHE